MGNKIQRYIELNGGPFDGVIHELQFGFSPPTEITLPDNNLIIQSVYKQLEPESISYSHSHDEIMQKGI